MTARKQMRAFGMALLALAGTGAASAYAAPKATASPSANQSKSFVDHAAIGGMFEVQSSQLAQKKASDSDLRAFADKMIRDHTAANDELRKLVQAGKVEGVTQVPTTLDGEHSSKLKELQDASNSSFDGTYRNTQIAAHQNAVELFKSESQSGEDPQLKNWASKTLPVLQRHLSLIKSISLSNSSASAAGSASSTATNTTNKTDRKDAQQLVTEAVSVVEEMKKDPQVAKLLEKAKGVYIVPDFGRAALGVGIRGGQGVMLAHADGQWSSPGFYDFGAISIGAQAGASGGSIAYILMSDDAVNEFKKKSDFSLNANAGLSVIDYSANAQGSYGKGDVVVWSDTKGLFGGVSVGVSDIVWSDDDNHAFYRGSIAPQQIFGRKGMQYSQAQELTNVLSE